MRKELLHDTIIRAVIGALLEKTVEIPDDIVQVFEKDYYERLDRYEKRFRESLIKIWNKQRKNVLANMKKVKKVDTTLVDFYVFGDEEWNDMLEEMEREEFERITEEEGEAVKEMLEMVAILISPLVIDSTIPYIKRKIDELSYRFARQVNGTTLELIKRELLLGIEEGQTMAQLRDRIEQLFDKWVITLDTGQSRSMLVARTETVKMASFIDEYGYFQSGVVEAKQWRTTMDDRTCSFCAALDGIIVGINEDFFNQGDSLTVESGTITFDYDDISSPPLHPNCFIDKNVPIYTSTGWIPISEIREGDIVFTHKGRFKKVTNIIQTKTNENTKIVRVSIKNRFIEVTEEHPLWVKSSGKSFFEWKYAKDIKVGDVCSLVDFKANKSKSFSEEVKNITYMRVRKGRTLYNFSVEDDESYVANLFLVHNCRCLIVPVIKDIYSILSET